MNSHRTTLPVFLVLTAIIFMCASSAGLSVYYAWTHGSGVHTALGVLLAGLALGLEIAKPVAIAQAFRDIPSKFVLRGLVLGAVGVSAMTYSLMAEMSLFASVRDRASSTISADIQKHNDAIVTTMERRRLIEQQIDALLMKPGANGCTKIDGKVSAATCSKVVELRGMLIELPVYAAHAAREGKPSLDGAAGASHQREQATVKHTDPGAYAIATYLALAGVLARADAETVSTVSQIMILVAVLALELGSAFGLVLAHAVHSAGAVKSDTVVQSDTVAQNDAHEAGQACEESGSTQCGSEVHATVEVRPTCSEVPPAAVVDDSGVQSVAKTDETKNVVPLPVSAAIRSVIAAVEMAGGVWTGSQNGLAKKAGVSAPSVGNALKIGVLRRVSGGFALAA